jgi:hypothetical protein
MAALTADKVRLASDSDRWGFLSLSDLVSCWEKASDELARLLASEAARVLQGWDRMISGVFDTRSAEGWTSLSALTQKFLAQVVARRVAQDLRISASEGDWHRQASRAEAACLWSRGGPR